MTTKINCPVCGRTEVTADSCPNCETDLTILKMLAELPVVSQAKSINIPLAILLTSLLLFAVFALGTTVNTNKQAIVVNTPTVAASPPLQATKTLPPCIQGFYYKVRSGDSLSMLAKRFYGQIPLYSLIVKANPSLIKREDSLEIGEILLIPNNIKEHTCGHLSTL